jgi:hypothetical protein
MYSLRIPVLVAGLLTAWGGANAAECSLVVKVVDTSGTPVHAWVRVDESGGRHVEKRHSPGGVRFCDLGIRPVQITVTPISASCEWSVRLQADLNWNRTTETAVTVPAGDCEFRPSALVLGKCRVLFRVRNEKGDWLPDAMVSAAIATSPERSSRVDEYGRALLRDFPLDSQLRVKVTAGGYAARTLEVHCNAVELEEVVEMRPGGEPR